MGKKSTDNRRAQIGKAIHAYLAGLSREELVQRLYEQAEYDEELWTDLQEECRFEPTAKSSKELTEWARQAIVAATKPGLEWGGDYDAVQKHLQKLLDQAQADAVLTLGVLLEDLASVQVEMSDEALMHDDVVNCMNLVFAALPSSTLTPVEQMAWVWERECKDRVDLCEEPAAAFWDQTFRPQDWAAFAARLQAEVDARPVPKTKKNAAVPSTDYQRDRLVKKIEEVLKKSK